MSPTTPGLVTVAALFVEEGGVYYNVPGVIPWSQREDARAYAGPYPVVAHPPCDRWGRMAPVNQARYGHPIGDDGGCFVSALESVEKWAGVLEQPEGSLAWRAHGIALPHKSGGWVRGKGRPGWTCCVEQGHYGHRARKATWLYYVGHAPPPDLPWGKGPKPTAWVSTDRPRAELAAMGIDQLNKVESKRTPLAFRDALINLARNALDRAEAA